MSEEKAPRTNDVPLAGLFLLFLGTLLLLQSLDILPWAIWKTLWRFWPVLLIMTGLGVLLRRFNGWLVSLLILAVLFASLGLAIWLDPRVSF